MTSAEYCPLQSILLILPRFYSFQCRALRIFQLTVFFCIRYHCPSATQSSIVTYMVGSSQDSIIHPRRCSIALRRRWYSVSCSAAEIFPVAMFRRGVGWTGFRSAVSQMWRLFGGSMRGTTECVVIITAGNGTAEPLWFLLLWGRAADDSESFSQAEICSSCFIFLS